METDNDAVHSALVQSGATAAFHRVTRKVATPEEMRKNAHLFTRVAQQRMLDIHVLLRSAQPSSASRNVEIVCSNAHRTRASARWRQIAMQSVGPRVATVPVPMSQWPRSTQIPCWTCEETFDTPPMPLVLSFEPKFGVFRIEGLFCNVRCMLWHAHSRYGKSAMYADIVHMSKNIAHLYFDIPMSHLYGVLPAPDPKKTLRKYQPDGGLSVEEYRDARFVARAAPVQEPPFLSFSVVLEATSARERDPTTNARVVNAGEESSTMDPSLAGMKRPIGAVSVAVAGTHQRDERTQQLSEAMNVLTTLPDAHLGRLPAGVRRVIRADKEKHYGTSELPQTVAEHANEAPEAAPKTKAAPAAAAASKRARAATKK